MSKHVLLTISILISNRPDTVRKCLDSIQPLLKAVPSELILTDTGCGEQVRSIIEEYTDHIIRFKWCNDFSKARNVGLKQAKGKWFLYLDDDEWFDDTTEIIDFFQSGEYKQYGLGVYSQRNYGNKEGTLYTDLLVGRMTRLEPDIKFKYSIHECFSRVAGKAKKFNVFVHHYGYVYENTEELHAHARRNIEPLLKEQRLTPNDMKHALQLTQEYSAIEDYENAVKVCRDAIAVAKKGPIVNKFCLASLYANEVLSLIDLGRYQEGTATGEEYLKLDELDPMAKAIMTVRLVQVYMRDGKVEKGFEIARFYWNIYQDYLADDEKYIEYSTNVTSSCFEPYNKSILLGNGVNAAVLLGKDQVAWEWFQAMEVEGPNVIYIKPEMARVIVEKLPEASGEARGRYARMCNTLLGREDMKALLTDTMITRCRRGETWEEKLRLMAVYGECVIEYQHPFRKMMQLAVAVCGSNDGKAGVSPKCAGTPPAQETAGQESRLPAHASQPTEIEQVVVWFWEHLSAHMAIMKEFDIIQMEERLGLDPGEILERVPFYVWQRELTAYFSQYSREETSWWTRKFTAYLTENSMRMLLWKAFTGIYDAIKEANKEGAVSMEAVLRGVRQYADSRIAICGQIYRPEILQNRRDVLPEEDQAAYRLIALEEQIDAGDYVNAVKEVKELKAMLPGLNPVMKSYLEWLSAKMEEQEQEKKQAANEFQILSVGVKLKIRQLTAAGNYQAALSVAQQLIHLMPEDEELLRQIEKLQGMVQES